MSASLTQLVESTYLAQYFTANSIIKPSIRQICLQALIRSAEHVQDSRALKREAKALIERHWPASAAAKKFEKHYAWYKGTAIKEGKIQRFSYPTDNTSVMKEIQALDNFQADLGATPLADVKEQLMSEEQLQDMRDQDRCTLCGSTYDSCYCDD